MAGALGDESRHRFIAAEAKVITVESLACESRTRRLSQQQSCTFSMKGPAPCVRFRPLQREQSFVCLAPLRYSDRRLERLPIRFSTATSLIQSDKELYGFSGFF